MQKYPLKKLPLVAMGVALGATATLVVSHPGLIRGQAWGASPQVYRELSLFTNVFDKVRREYVDKPDDKLLIEHALDGMVNKLDPHSQYMNAKDYNAMQAETNGEFGGLGLEVAADKGVLKVISPIDGTPAAKAGILSGDLIIAIDGVDVKTLTLAQAVHKMRGKSGSTVVLTVLHGPAKKKTAMTLTRAMIQVASVKSKVIDGDIDYIRISEFTEQTFPGLKKAIAKAKKDIPADKFKGYIIDLRNNPGGLLDQAIEVVNTFVDRGEIVSTRGRHRDETQRFDARPGGDLSDGKPMVVLINGGSASASEIVAGALQDHKRATLIGTRSFGKGSVQTIIPLGTDNGALRLTTARYYTPSGRSIQAQGIEPQYKILEPIPKDLVGKDEIKGEASLKGHLLNGTDEKHGSQAFVPADVKYDNQLIAAENLLHGKKIVSETTQTFLPTVPAKKTAEAAKPPVAPGASSGTPAKAAPPPIAAKPAVPMTPDATAPAAAAPAATDKGAMPAVKPDK